MEQCEVGVCRIVVFVPSEKEDVDRVSGGGEVINMLADLRAYIEVDFIYTCYYMSEAGCK